MTDENQTDSGANDPRLAGPQCSTTATRDGTSDLIAKDPVRIEAPAGQQFSGPVTQPAGHRRRENGKAESVEVPVAADAGHQILMVQGEIGRGENTPLDLAWKLAERSGDIYLRSAGGSFHDGLAMAHQVKKADRLVYAPFCGSAAVMILTAGKRRIMPSNGWVLIHSGWWLFGGPARLLRPQLEHQERVDAAYHEWLVTHSNAGPELVTEWMQGETFLSPEQALQYGLIDAIGQPENVPSPEPKSEQLTVFKRQQRLCAEVAASAPRKPTDQHLDALATSLAQYRAPCFDALIDGGKPECWPMSPTVAAAAAGCWQWTRAAVIRHEDQGKPLPEHPWPARWACPECGEFNFHPPHRADGDPAACVFCDPPNERKDDHA